MELHSTKRTKNTTKVVFLKGEVKPTSGVVDFEPLALAKIAADAASSKKGIDTKVLDVSALHGLVDYFVITSVGNSRQIRAIIDEMDEMIRIELGVKPLFLEGLGSSDWVLVDYAGVVVHIFSETARSFYDLERLWSDAALVYQPDSAIVASTLNEESDEGLVVGGGII